MTVTYLICSDYKCTRTNIESYNAGHRGEAPASLSNIKCKVHAGAMKRAIYQPNPTPLSGEDRERLLAEQAAIDVVRAEEARVQREANAVRAAQRHAEEWKFQDVEASYEISQDADRWSTQEEPEPTWEGHVWTGEARGRTHDSRWFYIEPTNKYYGGKSGGTLYPYAIRITRGSELSPNEARALAYALQEAAAKAELLNEKRKPK